MILDLVDEFEDLSEDRYSELREEDDSAVVVIDGEEVAIEQALIEESVGQNTGLKFVNGLLSRNANFVSSDGTSSVFTYSFLNSGSAEFDDNVGNFAKQAFDWQPLTEKERVREAIALIENVTDIVFVEVNDDSESADFKFILTRYGAEFSNFSRPTTAGRAAFPGEDDNGFVYFNGGLNSWNSNLQQGSRIFSTIFHEIMHALGLEHPHSNIKFPGVVNSRSSGDGFRNQGLYTAMSYDRGVLTPGNPSGLDIAALQYMNYSWLLR